MYTHTKMLLIFSHMVINISCYHSLLLKCVANQKEFNSSLYIHIYELLASWSKYKNKPMKSRITLRGLLH